MPQGLSLLDEAMLAALSDRLQPMWTGAIYCGLLDACHELVDHAPRRDEWTDGHVALVLAAAGGVALPGHLSGAPGRDAPAPGRVGAKPRRRRSAACADMVRIDVFAVAGGWYEVGEIRRARGDLDGAEEAYRQAHEIGRDPQPGLALLRLAQGRVDAARTSIATAIAAFGGSRLECAPLHAAQVDIALAAGDLDTASASAERGDRHRGTVRERRTARRSDCGPRAPSHWLGAKAVAALGIAPGGVHRLERARRALRSGAHPGHARRRVRAARRRRRRRARTRRGPQRASSGSAPPPRSATLDRARQGGADTAAHGLSPREREVLGLVASGATNREIAGGAVPEREDGGPPLSNIFTKLGVSSRSAATAYAYEHGLVGAPSA